MPSVELTIRQAEANDVPQILQFIKELAAYEKLSPQVTATERALRNSLFGAQKSAEAVIAEQNKTPLDFALFFHNFSTFEGRPGLYLEDIYVQPESRGKGVGTALMKHLAATALERNCARMEWSVLNWNENAIKLYKTLGSAPMNEWRVYRLTGEPLAKLAQKNIGKNRLRKNLG